jgi:hypothetical protein
MWKTSRLTETVSGRKCEQAASGRAGYSITASGRPENSVLQTGDRKSFDWPAEHIKDTGKYTHINMPPAKEETTDLVHDRR